jgi:hypothetical protein
MATVTLLKWLPALGAIAVIMGYVRMSLLFRTRAMRAFAERWHLQYVGPATPSWQLLLARTIKPSVPIPFSLDRTAKDVKQIWNVIEGQQSGVQVLIFDAYVGTSKRSYRTFFAAKTKQTPVGLDTRRDCIVQSNGWTILIRAPFPLEVPWATWSMNIRYLERHLSTLRVAGAQRNGF